MRAAIYLGNLAPDAAEAELTAARAFCVQHGLLPVRIDRADMVQDKREVDAFLLAARTGAFRVVVAPFPDCFSTRILKGLVDAGVGLACHFPAVRPAPGRAARE